MNNSSKPILKDSVSKSAENKTSDQKNQPEKDKDKDQNNNQQSKIAKTIIKSIDKLKEEKTFKDYPIRDLVNQSKDFGEHLKNNGLKTTQIRKFLDAINRIKIQLAKTGENNEQNQLPNKIKDEIILLKPKLAYAAARKEDLKPLSNVMEKAIDRVQSLEDFERLVQFIQSIIAYHKAAGGE